MIEYNKYILSYRYAQERNEKPQDFFDCDCEMCVMRQKRYLKNWELFPKNVVESQKI